MHHQTRAKSTDKYRYGGANKFCCAKGYQAKNIGIDQKKFAKFLGVGKIIIEHTFERRRGGRASTKVFC